MESGFTSDTYEFSDETWQRITHRGSGRFEFFRVRLFGAMHFVKRPSPRHVRDLLTTESLRKEFNIGYNLSHTGIVKYLRMENGAVFQEYVDGLSIQQMIEQDDPRLKSPQFLERMCRQLLEATDYLHSHGVVHNDIKPENVMITRINDQVKLVDLGCASSDMWNATEGYTSAFKAPEQGVSDSNVYTDIFLIGRLMEILSPMAGVRDTWADFIKKATADNISDRYFSDKEAISHIPKEDEKIGWAGWIMAVFLLLIFIIGGSKLLSYVESWGAQVYDKLVSFVYPSDTAEVENNQQTVIVDSYLDEEWSRQAKVYIDDKLTDLITSKYEEVLFPLCRQFAEMPAGKERYELGLRIDSVKDNMIDGIIDYANDLKNRFPTLSVYIANTTYDILEQQQLKAENMKH